MPSPKISPSDSRMSTVPPALTRSVPTAVSSSPLAAVSPMLEPAVKSSTPLVVMFVVVSSSTSSMVLPVAVIDMVPSVEVITSTATPLAADSNVIAPLADWISESVSMAMASVPVKSMVPDPPVWIVPLTVRALAPVVSTSIAPVVELIVMPLESVNAAPELISMAPAPLAVSV